MHWKTFPTCLQINELHTASKTDPKGRTRRRHRLHLPSNTFRSSLLWARPHSSGHLHPDHQMMSFEDSKAVFFLSVLQCFSFLFIFQDDKKVEDNDSFYKRRRRTVCSFLEPVNIVQYFKSWNTHTSCHSSCIHSIRDSCCTNCCIGH